MGDEVKWAKLACSFEFLRKISAWISILLFISMILLEETVVALVMFCVLCVQQKVKKTPHFMCRTLPLSSLKRENNPPHFVPRYKLKQKKLSTTITSLLIAGCELEIMKTWRSKIDVIDRPAPMSRVAVCWCNKFASCAKLDSLTSTILEICRWNALLSRMP